MPDLNFRPILVPNIQTRLNKSTDAARIRESTMNTPDSLKRITIQPDQCGGRPCVPGTKMRVVDVLELLSSGAEHAEILRDYPSLERKDILACLEYAARQIEHTEIQSA